MKAARAKREIDHEGRGDASFDLTFAESQPRLRIGVLALHDRGPEAKVERFSWSTPTPAILGGCVRNMLLPDTR